MKEAEKEEEEDLTLGLFKPIIAITVLYSKYINKDMHIDNFKEMRILYIIYDGKLENFIVKFHSEISNRTN